MSVFFFINIFFNMNELEKIKEEVFKERPVIDRARVERKVNKFMKSVRIFLTKNNGEVAPEWECSLMILEEYYKQFLLLSEEINNLESFIVIGYNGDEKINALLGARDKAAVRLEAMMKSCGITFKEATKLSIVEIEEEKSDLELFLENRMNNK